METMPETLRERLRKGRAALKLRADECRRTRVERLELLRRAVLADVPEDLHPFVGTLHEQPERFPENWVRLSLPYCAPILALYCWSEQDSTWGRYAWHRRPTDLWAVVPFAGAHPRAWQFEHDLDTCLTLAYDMGICWREVPAEERRGWRKVLGWLRKAG